MSGGLVPRTLFGLAEAMTALTAEVWMFTLVRSKVNSEMVPSSSKWGETASRNFEERVSFRGLPFALRLGPGGSFTTS